MDLLFDIPLRFMPPFAAAFALCAFGVVLAWASVVDIRRRIVPGIALIAGVLIWAAAFVLAAAADAAGQGGVRPSVSWARGIAAGCAGAALVAAFSLTLAFLLSRAAGRAALGMGDVKLLFVMGLHCGATGALACLGAACVLAALYCAVRFACDRALAALRSRRPTSGPSPAPFDGTFAFVPFLAVAFALVAPLSLLG